MPHQPTPRPQPPENADPLAEVYRRLVSIHHALATDLDGGAELQTRMRHRVEDLLEYVGAKLDLRETSAASAAHASEAGAVTSSSSRESRRP